MPPAKCPFLHRCNKYTDLTLRIDRLVESSAAKDRRIAALEAENAALKAAQCGSSTNPADVRIFGSSTPSSLIPIKANSTEEARKRKGGKARCMHVQPRHVEIVRKAVENGRRLEEMILDEGIALLERLREQE